MSAEEMGEMGGRTESAETGHFGYGAVGFNQQCLSVFEAGAENILLRRFAGQSVKHAAEMRPAHAECRGESVDPDGLSQMVGDIHVHRWQE
jgi:hypothetical protein